MPRKEKTVGSDLTLMLMLLGGAGIIGVVLVIVFVKLKAENPIIKNPGRKEFLVAPPPSGDINIESPTYIPTNDPRWNAFQAWKQAKETARENLEKAIGMCEQTITYAPTYAGDAYFTCVQCIDYYLETRLYYPYQRKVPKSQFPITAQQAKGYFERQFTYYDKAIRAYQQPGAQTMLGITRQPDEMLRRIEELVGNKRDKIIPWWMDFFAN